MIAIALDYGYYISLQGGFPTEGKTVLFCDMGCIACTVTVVHYTNVVIVLLQNNE